MEPIKLWSLQGMCYLRWSQSWVYVAVSRSCSCSWVYWVKNSLQLCQIVLDYQSTFNLVHMHLWYLPLTRHAYHKSVAEQPTCCLLYLNTYPRSVSWRKASYAWSNANLTLCLRTAQELKALWSQDPSPERKVTLHYAPRTPLSTPLSFLACNYSTACVWRQPSCQAGHAQYQTGQGKQRDVSDVWLRNWYKRHFIVRMRVPSGLICVM